MPQQCWKVGELAARTGLTVRTLHHYDAIGRLGSVNEDDRDKPGRSPRVSRFCSRFQLP